MARRRRPTPFPPRALRPSSRLARGHTRSTPRTFCTSPSPRTGTFARRRRRRATRPTRTAAATARSRRTRRARRSTRRTPRTTRTSTMRTSRATTPGTTTRTRPSPARRPRPRRQPQRLDAGGHHRRPGTTLTTSTARGRAARTRAGRRRRTRRRRRPARGMRTSARARARGAGRRRRLVRAGGGALELEGPGTGRRRRHGEASRRSPFPESRRSSLFFLILLLDPRSLRSLARTRRTEPSYRCRLSIHRIRRRYRPCLVREFSALEPLGVGVALPTTGDMAVMQSNPGYSERCKACARVCESRLFRASGPAPAPFARSLLLIASAAPRLDQMARSSVFVPGTAAVCVLGATSAHAAWGKRAWSRSSLPSSPPRRPRAPFPRP